MEGLYVLEAQKYLIETPLEGGRFVHVGYVDKIFTSKLSAICYYDDNNTHMRSINAFANLCSDWDPKTYLRYVIRRYFGEKCTVTPFAD